MKFEKLERDAPISKRGIKKTIEGIRESVVKNKNNIRISQYENNKRVGIYRSGIKVAVVEIKESLSDDKIFEGMKEEILKGTFDHEIRDVYREMYQQRVEKRKAKEEEVK